MKKKESSHFEFFGDGKVCLCQWNENKPVHVLSNFADAEPTKSVRRGSASKKSNVYSAQPKIIETYNKHMDSVDLFDHLLSDYRPRLHSKKWWWCLFSNFLNMPVAVSWRLHKVVGGKDELPTI